MAKERRARLAPRPAPVIAGDAALTAVSEVPSAGAPGQRRRDVRSTEHVAALYARVPAATKRRLDVATAMTGRKLSDVVTALIDAHVDPGDPNKQSTLEQLLRR